MQGPLENVYVGSPRECICRVHYRIYMQGSLVNIYVWSPRINIFIGSPRECICRGPQRMYMQGPLENVFVGSPRECIYLQGPLEEMYKECSLSNDERKLHHFYPGIIIARVKTQRLRNNYKVYTKCERYKFQLFNGIISFTVKSRKFR